MEPHVLCGSRMNLELMGPAYPMGDRWHHVGDAWDLVGPYESCVHCMGAQGSNMVKQLHMAPILAHAAPIWHH
jgi:hypothetical protein